ncbi:TetR/AcrR family transcriptional regulator [candidate division KSB1 bacterium]|nr:TetR/AcrR family transcriptional regulator [candidate division KSB1 bacterium]
MSQTENKTFETKEKIFTVAAHLFADKGFNGVSMREISLKSGVSKPTIYYYFGNKEGIYQDLVKAGLDYTRDELKKIIGLQLPVKEKLTLALKTFFEMCVKHPEFVKLVTMVYAQLENNPILEKFNSEDEHPRKLLERMICDGIRSGEFADSIDPQITEGMVSGVFLYYIWQHLNGSWNIQTDKLAEQIIDNVFKGLNG